MTTEETGLKDRLRRGMDLLQPTRSVRDWQAGMKMVEAASNEGLAEASEQRAVFESFAIGRPANWDSVLDFLALAADQGSVRAADQLAILAGGASPTGISAGQWQNFRKQISAERLLSSPPVQLASAIPRIGAIEGFASPAECRWLIGSAAAKLEPSTVYDSATGGLRQDPQRTNRSAYIDPLKVGVLAQLIRARLAHCIGLAIEQFEASQLLHYSVGQEFKPHHDYLDPDAAGFKAEIAIAGQRVATQLIYLNDDFEGGGTQFPSLELNYRGRTGDALMFFNISESGDPEPLTLHCGLPPTSGEKWIFSQWIRDRAPAPKQ